LECTKYISEEFVVMGEGILQNNKKSGIFTLIISCGLAAIIDKTLHRVIGFEYNVLLDDFNSIKLLLDLLIYVVCLAFVFLVMNIRKRFIK